MKKILITGTGSFIGSSVQKYLQDKDGYLVDTVDTLGDEWKKVDYSQYDIVYHVAGIAHVNAASKMKPLYYKINRDLTLEVAKLAKVAGVKQFIFMSSQIVFHESKSLKKEIITKETTPNPNGFYGDSKLQAELGLHELESESFNICILRPCLVYGPNSKGNFPRLVSLAQKTPIFPAWHNKRGMLYIDNLCEFVKQAIDRELRGTFYLQNRELADTVEIIRFFAKKSGHRIWITKLVNPFVWIGSFILQPINKMFSTYHYESNMSKYDFEYQIVSFEESLNRVWESIK